MGQITILNGTNTVINSCISIGVNYSWCNKLSPKKYYKHNGVAGIYTLNTNYWFSEATEFKNSGMEIGLFVGGLVVGVIGLAAIPFTLGGSISLVVGAATIAGGVSSAAGLAISGLSIAAREFNNSPSQVHGVPALEDRKYIAESTVTLEKVPNADGTFTMKFLEIPQITLRELSDSEFHRLLESGEYTEHQSKPIAGAYLSSEELDSLGLKEKPVTIRPAWGGDACWEVENDNLNEGAPMQLWSRPGNPRIEWTLQPVTDDPKNSEFYLYNTSLKRYMGADATLQGQVRTKATVDARDSFHVVKTEDLKHTDSNDKAEKDWFVFIPSKAKELTVIAEGGNNGNSTKLKFGPHTTIHPTWATWKITPRVNH